MNERTKRVVATAIIHTSNLNNCTVDVALRDERRLLVLTALVSCIIFGVAAVLIR